MFPKFMTTPALMRNRVHNQCLRLHNGVRAYSRQGYFKVRPAKPGSWPGTLYSSSRSDGLSYVLRGL